MKSHAVVLALAVVLVAWPAVSQDQESEEDPIEEQWRKIQEEQEKGATIKDTPVPPPGLVTLELENTPIRKAVESVASVAREKIEVHESVVGTITLKLEGVPWRVAIVRIATAIGARVQWGVDGSVLVHKKPVAVPKTSNDGKLWITNLDLDAWGNPEKYKYVKFMTTFNRGATAWSPALVTWGPETAGSEKLLADLEKAVKALRAAGLEAQAKATEKELARRRAAKAGWVVVGDARLLTTIRQLRSDVAILRKEVRELTALVKQLVEKK